MENVSGVLGTRKFVQRIPTNYWLEDLSGRIKLEGNTDGLCTGAVVGVLGAADHLGVFQVEEVRFPDFPPEIARPVPYNGFLCLISGIECGSEQDFLS